MTQTPTLPSTSAPEAGNASALLAVMGGILILGGLGCGGGVVAYTLAMPALLRSAPPEAGMLEGNAAMAEAMQPLMVMTTIFYGGVGLAISWLGIGSVRARRWSWKLILSVGWLWVGLMGISAIAYAFMLPQIMHALGATSPSGMSPSSAPSGIMLNVIMLVAAVVGLMFYIAPGVALIVVYGLRSVRTTCERRDPTPRWTDQVPVPVLVLWQLFLFVLFGALVFSPAYFGLAKMPGMANLPTVVTGVAWSLVVPLLAFTCRELALMHRRGWWLALTTVMVGMGLAIWLAGNYDILDFYRDLETPDEALEDMKRLFGKINIFAPTAFGSFAILGYVVWLKRFFPPSPPS